MELYIYKCVDLINLAVAYLISHCLCCKIIICQSMSLKFSNFCVVVGHLEFWASGMLHNLAPYLNRFSMLV